MKNKKIIIASSVIVVIAIVVCVFSIRFAKAKKVMANSNSENSTSILSEETQSELNELESLAETTTESITEAEITTVKHVVPTTKKETQNNQSLITEKVPENKPVESPKTILNGNIKTTPATALEKTIFEGVNQQRRNNGLPNLIWNDNLHSFARTRAEECKITKSHTRPNGKAFHDVFKESGLKYPRVGENIVYGGHSSNPELVAKYIDAWMNSSSHKKAILDNEFKYSAIGIYIDEDGYVYAVQLFSNPI